MKRKHKIVLGVTLLVLCISIGLGIALWYLFGGNPNDSGDNGDDTTTVTPGDPDENPETPHEHTYTSAVTKEPTCTQEGEMTYTCTCGDSYTEPIAMTAHTEVIDEAVAPSCTKTGLTEGKHCSVCGTVLVEQEVVPMTAHTEVIDAAVAPTCTATGLTEGKHCSVCGEILVEQQAIAMIPHDYSDEWDSDDENHWHVCTECGARADIAAHIPDRDQPGENAPVKCTVCGYIIEPATGHIVHTAGNKWFSDGVSHWQICIGCGIKMNESAHSGGLATCISKAQCAVCNAQYGELAAHSSEIIPAVAPTCTKTGLTEGQKCSVCGTVLVEQEVIPMAAHTEVIDAAVKPTCTQTGLTEGKHCSVCGTVLVEQEVVPTIPHTEVIDEAVAPTCTKTGLTEGKHCSVCDTVLVEQEVVPTTEHSYTSKVTKQPTCTEKGVRTYTCSVCGDSYTEDIEANGHTIVIDEAVEPTCTDTGLTEGKHCSVCGEVLVEQEVVPMTEHSYTSEVTKQPTCSQTGERTYTCSACGDSYTASIAALGHQYRVTSRKEATCTQAGEVVYTCTRCGDGYTVKTNASHNYVLVETVAATCTEAGYQLYRCSECEEEFKNIIPAGGGHNYVGTVTLAPTTEREGEMTYTCSVCGDSYTVPLAKLNSGSGYVLLIQDRLPWTTDNNAVILNYLTQSGQIGGWEVVTTQQAAATDFSAFGIIYIANDQTTATYNRLEQLDEELTQFVQGGGVLIYGACDHGWAAGDISYALPGGVSIQNYYSNYNYIVNSAHDIVTGVLTGGEAITDRILYSTYSSHTTFHDLPADADIILQDAKGDPTLVEYALGNGYVIASGLTWEYTYDRTFVDGTSFAKEIYDDLFVYAQTLISGCEHEYLAGETVAPTCSADGYTVYTCTVCGRTYHGDYVEALGHSYTSEVTKQPTCTEEGIRTYTCSACGNSYTESIPMTAHTEVIDEAVEPTCTATGLTEGKHCSVCGEILVAQQVIPANGHSYASSVTKQPTCTEEGVRTYICSVCGDSYTESIPMTAHTEVIDEAITPTCIKTGLTEGKHCSVCGEVLVEQEVVPTIAHNYVGEETKKPTCEQEGEMTYTCTACGDSYTESIPMTAHNYMDEVTKQPTCTEEGERTYTCSVCGDSYTESIPMTAHTEVIDEAVAPTCTKTGLTEGKHCSVCGEVLVEQETLPTIDHNYVNGVCTMCGKPDESYATNGLVFTISNDGTYYSVTDYTGSATEVYIPSKYKGLPVTSIRDRAFSGCSSLTSITIPDSVTSIGSNAFRNCSSLTNVTLPSSVTSIGYSAFYNCSGLTSITIPDSITSIGERVFSGCSSLTSIEIPDSVTSIGDYAFYGCSSLTSIKLPDSVTSIGDSAFYGCRSLTSITIPNSVTSIGDYAFRGCSSLTSIKIPDGVTSIGKSAFQYCSSLTSIKIPDSVTSIGEWTFYSCSSLTSITIPDGVTSIERYAFTYCSSLTSIDIPDSVTSIGEGAFSGCSSLTSITVASGNPVYQSAGNCIIKTESKTLIVGCSNSVIPSDGSVTSIGDYAFAWCSSLTSITIPDSVTSIGCYAFYHCSSLTSVTFEDPEGWYVTHSEGATSGTDLANSDLSNPATAARYLRNTYYTYYWYKR